MEIIVIATIENSKTSPGNTAMVLYIVKSETFILFPRDILPPSLVYYVSEKYLPSVQFSA